tara:strand:- start:2660 stop:2935 length:276 start_codon:yes stop_codon:yes gene_type:complete
LKGVKVLKEKCTVDDAKDKSLPYSAYLVEYKVDNVSCFDIALTGKESDLFDYYYDLYKKDFVKFTQSEGRSNPKLWNDPNQPKPPKKGRKK